jgi:hypothetical protein
MRPMVASELISDVANSRPSFLFWVESWRHDALSTHFVWCCGQCNEFPTIELTLFVVARSCQQHPSRTMSIMDSLQNASRGVHLSEIVFHESDRESIDEIATRRRPLNNHG